MAEKRRAARIKDRIREELMRSLHRDLTDPRLAHIIVTRVDMPDDLQLAIAYVRLESGGDVPAQRKVALAGLKSATGRLRKSIGGALKLRYTPELRFAYDEILDATTRVEALLHEIAAEGGEKKPELLTSRLRPIRASRTLLYDLLAWPHCSSPSVRVTTARRLAGRSITRRSAFARSPTLR